MEQLSMVNNQEIIIILISLKPQFYQLIMEEKKKHEFRKKFPDKKVKAFIYVTKPIGAIKALFEFDTPIKEPTGLIGHQGTGVQEFINGEKPGRVALPIQKTHLLSKEVNFVTMREKFHITAPQSYVYLDRYPELLTYLLSLLEPTER
jgi:predicted transcriptional regulator